MHLILHVGMGKNGSTSIQQALRLNQKKLADQKAEYLGIWFDMIDPAYSGFIEQMQLWTLPHEEKIDAGLKLASFLKRQNEKSGAEKFILSNESWSGQAKTLKPVLDQLADHEIEITVVAFVRNPISWLPSAHVQWGIRNKLNNGPILSFESSARDLIRWYVGIIEWAEEFPSAFKAISYDLANDVVEAFAQEAGLEMDRPEKRLLERGEEAEILMRALFNERYEGREIPETFNEAVFPASAGIPKLEEMAERCFEYAGVEDIILEHSTIFEVMSEKIGFDVREMGGSAPSGPDMDIIRARLLDFLIEIAFRNGMRVKALEERISCLEREVRCERS